MSLAFDGYNVSVVDYLGAEAGMPESAERLIGAIDLHGGANKWTKGDENTVAALNRENFDFHSQKAGSILAVAARLGNLKAVQDLVAAGAPLGIGMTTFLGAAGPPLRSAVENNNILVLEFLIEAGASNNDPAAKEAALNLAIQKERKEAIALLRQYITTTK
jgi:ankyrin repeat protein